ncbi:MAG: ATP synthase F1 subunit delta [Rickettsiales bacterium]|nr:MAG: ATP synthase F1 subunit delta [Rickettsiales bacterium]
MLLDLKVVKNYAQALFLKAKDLSKEDKILEQISIISDITEASPLAKEVLCSPIIDHSLKIKLIDLLAKKYKFDKISQRFLYVLVKNTRCNFISKIVDEFGKMLAESKGIKAVNVSSAFKLGKKELSFIKGFLETELNKKIELTTKEDASLIGGVVIEYDSNLIDCSVHGALEKIQKVALKSKV